MALTLYTGRLAQPKYGLAGYAGPDAFDVTRGTGGAAAHPFAPSHELLMEGLRRKKVAGRNEAAQAEAWAWYAPRFVEEMRLSWRANGAAWRELLDREGEVTLCCYCGKPDRCHRSLLAGMLVKAGAKLGLAVVYAGEREVVGEAPHLAAAPQSPEAMWGGTGDWPDLLFEDPVAAVEKHRERDVDGVATPAAVESAPRTTRTATQELLDLGRSLRGRGVDRG